MEFFVVNLSNFILIYNTNLMNKLKFIDLQKKLKLKKINYTNFLQFTKSAHFPLR